MPHCVQGTGVSPDVEALQRGRRHVGSQGLFERVIQH